MDLTVLGRNGKSRLYKTNMPGFHLYQSRKLEKENSKGCPDQWTEMETGRKAMTEQKGKKSLKDMGKQMGFMNPQSMGGHPSSLRGRSIHYWHDSRSGKTDSIENH